MSCKQILAIAALSALPVFAQEPPMPPVPAAPPEVFAIRPSGSFLGVGVREVDSERAKAMKLPGEYGVEITKVDEASPAEKAGLKVGDVVQAYNGQRVEGTEQFVRMVRETPAGRTAQLGIIRGGAQQTLSATIAARKSSAVFMSGPGGKTVTLPNFERHMEFTMPDIPKATMSWRSSMLGVEAEPLKGSQLASFFGVSEGVLVRGVIKDTSAEKAGIKAGDVIVKIEGTAVEAPRDITTAINAARKDGKKTVNITLVRDRKETTVSAAIEDEASSMPRPRGTRVTVKQNNL